MLIVVIIWEYQDIGLLPFPYRDPPMIKSGDVWKKTLRYSKSCYNVVCHTTKVCIKRDVVSIGITSLRSISGLRDA